MLCTTHIRTSSRNSRPGSRTHDAAERALDRRKDGLTHRSLPVAGRVDPRVMRVIDGPEQSVFDQRSDAFVAKALAQAPPVVAFVGREAAQVARVPQGDLRADPSIVTLSRGAMHVDTA